MNILMVLMLVSTLALANPVDLPINANGGISYAPPDLYSRRGELIPPKELFDFDELEQTTSHELKEQIQDLKAVKFYLLNGETKLAKVRLKKIAGLQTKLRPIVYRYLGILSFIEGDFRRSFEYLNILELRAPPHFAKICTLKVLDEVVLNITDRIESDWNKCRIENSTHFGENLVWLETLIDLKINPRHGVTEVPFKKLKLSGLTINDLKLFLKLGLYLNQETLLLKELNSLGVDQLQDTEVRELVGQIHFRTGSLALAYKYIEDLKSPNAENIKGNLYILRNKYELAYAQFNLALEQKQNSQNALERLLPLAWLLGDWKGGTRYAEMIIATPQLQSSKMTLIAAFLMQKGDFVNTRKVLDAISERSRRGTQIDVTQLYSFVSLMQNKRTENLKYAEMSCAQYDLINCWLLFQIDQWGSFSTTVRREEPISHKKVWEKLIKEEIDQPLKETVYVNQLDIEEMDDKLIQLVPR